MRLGKKTLSGQLGNADLRLLRIYRAVVECGGFSAAEVDLNISRAAISMAISDLETRLSLRLCQRGRSGFALTEEGKAVYESSLQLLAAVEEFGTRINSLHECLTGELNIGITDNLVTIPQMHITHALSALKERGPDVRINIRMKPPRDIELDVMDGRLHTGVVPALETLPGLQYRSLYEEVSQLYCAFNHPLFEAGEVKKDQLEHWDAVIPAYAQAPETRLKHEPLKAAASATDREGVAFLILSGRYIGYLPTHYAQRWVDEGRMRALNPRTCRYVTRYSAITRKTGPPNRVLETYLEELMVLTEGVLDRQ
ncbi:LysR family transcriptional regulator [Modicisalibacter xianhensis]|uniref:Transcriptional regulator, LysR family n=1 Tax=Modicisalibacter xianhensis TaxID=442341 RepID=A0A1I3FTN3_9GAMM|nr:LysR family transcriptional regulator [Halomonas xianhensis]SFI14291.1 transcriptional regulator, LysR family [Halomonas xianhensis]